MLIDYIFITTFTNLHTAVMLSLFVISLSLTVHGFNENPKARQYSTFLKLNHTTPDVRIIIGIITCVLALVFIFGTVDRYAAYTEKGITGVGLGVFLYPVTFCLVLIIFLSTPLREKNAIKSTYSFEIKRLTQLLSSYRTQLNTYQTYEGKTKWKIESILHQLNHVEATIKSEKKIRKNRLGIYASISRLKDIEQAQKKVTRDVESFAREVMDLYDQYYELELTVDVKQPEVRKQLQTVKETLERDPYAVETLMKRMKTYQEKQVAETI